ncbi:MAG: peptidoglycan-binding protein [Tissierellia bacterium]|nr:peptidoglycan-binding protein [Tissierellia bacterium]
MKKLKITAMLMAATMFLASCGNKSNVESNEDSSQTSKQGQEFFLRRSVSNPQGDKSFSSIAVITDGETIYDVSIDEYQYMDNSEEIKPVPASDGEFGNGAVAGKVLISKLQNEEYYSNLMKEHANATKTLKEGYNAIEEYVNGKTIDELSKEVEEKGDDIVDAISESTLVSTKGYIEAIIKAAENDRMQSVGKTSDIANLKIKRNISTPHGDKSFAEVFVAMDGDKIAAASIDEYQYMDGTPLPSADGEFGTNFKDAPLISKVINQDAYSKLMKENAESTKSINENYEDIQNFAAGKTAEEIEKAISDAGEDAVTEATLVDQNNYLQSIADTAKAE